MNDHYLPDTFDRLDLSSFPNRPEGGPADVSARDLFGRTLLHIAAMHNDTEATKRLLDHGAEVDARDPHSATPLERAADSGHYELAHILLEAGAEHTIGTAASMGVTDCVSRLVGTLDGDIRDSWPAWMAAANSISARQTPVLGLLLEAGIDADSPPCGGTPLLHQAAVDGNLVAAQVLVAAGASTTLCDSDGRSPLLLAAWRGNRDMVDFLLEHGAGAAIGEHQLDSLLYGGIWAGSAALVEACLAMEASVGPRAIDPECSPLLVAAGEGNVEIIRLLLDAGADVNHRGYWGASPLHMAVASGNSAAAEVLVDVNAEVDAEDGSGMAPLDLAVLMEHSDIAGMLVGRGARTTVLAAAHAGDLRAVLRLVDEGRTVEAAATDGRTLLRRVVEVNHLVAAQTLIEAGAEVGPVYARGITPLYVACREGYGQMAALLLRSGARHTLCSAAVQGDMSELRRLLGDGREEAHSGDTVEAAFANAVYAGHLEAVQLLLDHIPDISIYDADERPLLCVAVSLGHVAIAELLLDAGASMNCTDYDCSAPLGIARRKGDVAMIALLRRRMARCAQDG